MALITRPRWSVTLPNATRVFYVVQDSPFALSAGAWPRMCFPARRPGERAAQRLSRRLEWYDATLQPAFQGDLALGDNAVFRSHSLELPTETFSLRHAKRQLAGYGYVVYLVLVSRDI